MADTQRDKSALAALFADNTTGEISPQDLRDFLESAHLSFGSMYISSSAETSIASQNTWTKAAGTTTDVNLHRFQGKTALAVDNRLKYTGAPDVHLQGMFSFSSSVAVANKAIEYAAYHYDDSGASGSILTHSIIRRWHSATDIGAGAVMFDVVLEQNDYIEMHVRNITDAANITLDYGYMFLKGLLI